VESSRLEFARGTLRLATLGNHNESQVAAGERRLQRLLGTGNATTHCPTPARAQPTPGRYRLETGAASGADAIIAVPWPSAAAGAAPEALWTEILMNRAGGWLARALLRPGLVSTARATALGGSRASALVIELSSVDGRREEAVAQVRGLLERLRAGAATPADARAAQRAVGLSEARRRLNPRARLVDLWHGIERERGSLSAMRQLHREAFEPGRAVVVLVDARP
jgi:hypothetical protein